MAGSEIQVRSDEGAAVWPAEMYARGLSSAIYELVAVGMAAKKAELAAAGMTAADIALRPSPSAISPLNGG